MSKVGKELENLDDQINWHWRYTMQPVRFFAFDARASLPLPLLVIYFRPSTLFISFVTLMFFRYLEQKGLTFPAALRNFRAWLVGRHRPGLVSVLKHKFIDYV